METINWQVVYLYCLRYVLFIASILFLSKAISVLIDYRTNKAKGALTTVGMCFFTSCYTFSIFLTTFGFTKNYADNMMPFNYIAGFLAYYFYTLTIEGYLKIKTKYFRYGQYLILITVICHLASFINVIFNSTPLLSYLPNPPIDSGYFKACNLFRVANMAGTVVGGAGSIGILLTLIIIYKILRTEYRNEKLLFWGVIITGVVSFNDTFLGLGYLKYSFPLYFLGNTLEAIRFSNHFKAVSLNIIHSLRSNLDQIEGKYHSLFENTGDAIIIHDIDHNILDANPKACMLYEYSHEQLIQMKVNDLDSPEETELNSERIKILFKRGHNAFEAVHLDKNGNKFLVEVNSRVVDFDKQKVIIRIGKDLTERKLAEIERTRLESQLRQAQKMEAIGTLAGGVAHDLNNVLSAQVAYPDLILMNLPDDSPLKQPILRIKESGKKAAAIVDDLLTLARRGVVITDVMNLNQIVDSYLNSPECEKLKYFHPDAIMKSCLDADLFNVMGSAVHLFKTVMNLINNAAEAMPQGGEIIISTQNQYVDTPIKGYDSIIEGEYAVLKISDAGTGIASEDIRKIFEPFYTKKVMGRSGTGLGMAVVWGTVKDHKGYIDVQSTPNKGTIFTLYFPITREEMPEQKTILMEKYMGKGESVLVVDDVEGQRDIASSLLKKMAYSVTTVASGEQAVDYMQENSADLVILDMIMDPGIDGCETYKRILELHPLQKAIITSGFSETGIVKEAQRLGAGEYIKKPYTLEKIGLAVKKELEKQNSAVRMKSRPT